MNLTAENTAIVLDSTADFPEAPERFPNWRVVPLYVRFGDESYRDYVELGPDEFYARLPHRAGAADDLAADARATSSRSTRSSRRSYERILSLQISSTLSGTFASAQAAAEMLGGDRVRVIDTRTRLGGDRDARARRAARLERGTTDEEIDALVARYQARAPPALHGRHARVPREGRPDRPGRRVRRQPAEREADPRRSATARSCR